MIFCLFLHPLRDIWVISILWLFQILQLWKQVCKYCFKTLLSILLGMYPEMGFLDHMVIPLLLFSRKLCIIFYNSCTILEPHQHCTRVPISSHPCQHLLFLFCFWLDTISLLGVRWHLVVLTCIFLITSDVEHFFMCLLALCLSSFGEMSVPVHHPFYIGLGFLWLSYRSSLYILDIKPISDMWFANIFSHTAGLSFAHRIFF